jgi:23S rRNA (pseudouridine1915-N3)-methyltransferase
MKVSLLLIGKTDFNFIEEGIQLYTNRIKHFISIDLIVLKEVKKGKSISENELKKAEGAQILQKLSSDDYVILLDEKGKEASSKEFARNLQNKMNSAYKNVVFIVGGPYGFSEEVYKRSNELMSLSKMTFSHQIVRVLFLEQLYRALTIIKGTPYHHE